MMTPKVDLTLLRRENEELQSAVDALKGGSSGGTSGGMERIWSKLEEHDKSLTRLEGAVGGLTTKIEGLVTWIVGTAIASFAVLAALLIGLWTFSANRNSEAMTAIQTVLAAKPAEPAPAPQPTIIVVPTQSYAAPTAPRADQPQK